VKLGGKVVAVSMDDAPTMKKFKESLKADYQMVPDPQGKIVAAYDVRGGMGPIQFANRFTFVIGQDGKVLQVQSGSDAIDPGGAIKACPLRGHPEEAPKVEPGKADAGSGKPDAGR
jgi:peroxiredoxin